MLALQGRRSTILKLCLDEGGFAFEHYFEEAANRFQNASDDPETFKVLEESTFRKLYPRSAIHNEGDDERRSGEEEDHEKEDYEMDVDPREDYSESEDPAAVFDVGGRLPVDW